MGSTTGYKTLFAQGGEKSVSALLLATCGMALMWDGSGDKQDAASPWSYPAISHCEQSSPQRIPKNPAVETPPASWLRRNLLAPIGISLPCPRRILPKDPSLTLAHRHKARRQQDEMKMRQLAETAMTSNASLRHDQNAMRQLHETLCEITYGKGVTPQAREDFLARYGCTGWTDEIVNTLLDLFEGRGIVEMGAGHGQWARTLEEAFKKRHDKGGKRFQFCLAYDDMSNLPLNPQIYHRLTQPANDYFGTVHPLASPEAAGQILRSWTCRGRALLLVYPPPGPMAFRTLQLYMEAAPENDTLIFVGEGRGGANGDDEFFDILESGEWILIRELQVHLPPGDKGYEKLLILQRKPLVQ